MTQDELFTPVPQERLELQSKEDLIQYIKFQEKALIHFKKENTRLFSLGGELKQKSFYIGEQQIILKNKLFGKSSEKSVQAESIKKDKKFKINGSPKVLLPSQRYPDAQLIEREVEFAVLPTCDCCSKEMQDSGMTEDSEFLTAIPKEYIVVRQKRHKYRCGSCHGDIKTAPAPPRIKDGSAYSDEMMVDVALTKYCDLIPIERYSKIAERAGIKNLPPQSLIECSHYVADFLKSVYQKLESELLAELVLHADETPHRMLERDKGCSWYLWGFSSLKTSYFMTRNTRSGDVASELLKRSSCEYLMSDVFSGYNKAVSDTNEYRENLNLKVIKNIYCNAHARRKFNDAKFNFKEESEYFINLYKKIYRLEDIAKGRPPHRVLRVRKYMTKSFEDMKNYAFKNIGGYSSKSSIYIAMNYFLKNYDEFILFIKNKNLPIDNNQQERLLRNPVIGRKTWYGTHSERGAETSAILFSIVETCKLNKINPREYFKNLVQDLHLGKKPYTPSEYKDLIKNL